MLKTTDGMAKEMEVESRTDGRKRTYKTENGEAKREKISEEVGRSLVALRNATNRGKVLLSNTDEVIGRTEEYFEACRLTGTFPSMMGLAAKGLGISRQAIHQYMRQHPDHPTTHYLEVVREVMADILVNSSLNNNANVVQVIFQLKNHFQHEDNVKVEAVQTSDTLLAGTKTRQEIEARYKESVVQED